MGSMNGAVSKRALIGRINRALAKNDQRLRTLRGDRGVDEVGRYFVMDIKRNVLVSKRVDLEDLGRRLGVLTPHESVER